MKQRLTKFLKRHTDIINLNNKYTVKRSPYCVKLPTKSTAKLCRFLGVMHGDGNMSFNRIHVSDKSKQYHTEVIAPMFRELFGVGLNLFHDCGRNSYYSHIKCSVLYRYLTEVLEIPKGAVREKLFISKDITSGSLKQRAAYIAGLFDAEGHISKRQAMVSFSTTSKVLHTFVQSFLKDIKVKFSPSERKRRTNVEYEIYLYGKTNINKFKDIVTLKHPNKVSRLSNF